MSMVDTRNDGDLVNRLKQLYQIARDERRNRKDAWIRNYRLLHNRVGSRAASSTSPGPRDSEIYPILSALVAWMSDQNVTADVSAACDPNGPTAPMEQSAANDMSVLIQSLWHADSWTQQIKLAIWDAFPYGAGFLKAVWDQSLNDGIGNATLKRVDPWAFYVDPNATSLDDAEYMIEVRRMSLDEIERRFPGKSTLVEARTSIDGDLDKAPGYVGDSGFPKANPGSLPGGNGRWGGVTSGPQYQTLDKGVVVYEFWIKENDEWYSDENKPDLSEKHVKVSWRVVVLAGGEVLLDEKSDDIYLRGGHPYGRFLFDDIGELYGIALIDHLAYPQIYINRLLTALQQNAELTGNPIFIEATNSGLDRVGIINKPGQRLRVTGAGMQNKPDWLQPPSMPPEVKGLVDFWIDRMENVSGLSAAAKTGATQRRTTDSTMGQIQEAAFVRVRSALSNLEMALEQLCYKVADLIIDNYDESRTVAVVGPSGAQSSLVLRGSHFLIPGPKGKSPLKYQLNINAGSAMPTSRQARAAQASQAYAMGLIDRQAWFEANQYPNWQAVLQRINQMEAAGVFNPPNARQRSRS